jgi:uncharacterized membrane protein
MAQFCSACGGQMAEGATTCPGCGKSTAKSVGGGAAAQMAPAAATTSGNDNVIALLCWSPVAIIGIIMGLAVEPYKNSKLVKFHAFQSLFTCIALIAVVICLGILGTVLSFLGPLALIVVPLYFVVWGGSIVLCIYMMIKAYKGEMTKLPVVGEFAAKQAGV